VKSFILGLALLASPALAASDVVMHRDPGCGCCEKWAAQVKKAFGRNVRVIDDRNRAAFQRNSGVPSALVSCHTAVIDGMIFEGHVPISDMQRVLKLRPAGIKGLAVSGMPLGSAGMEVPGVPAQRYNVIAFGGGGTRIYARH